jgi:hypothetical protein
MQQGGAAALGALAAPDWKRACPGPKLHCVFELAVITDEISEDFGHALEIASKEFGLG